MATEATGMLCSLERFYGIPHPAGIDANRADGDLLIREAQGGRACLAGRLPGLGAQAPDPPRRVIAGQGGQVDAGDGAQQPGGLPVFLDRAAGGQSGHPPLDRAAVRARTRHPVKVQRDSGIASVGRYHESVLDSKGVATRLIDIWISRTLEKCQISYRLIQSGN